MNEQESKARKALEHLEFEEKIKRGEMTRLEYDIEMERRAANLPKEERAKSSSRGAQNTIK